jgi:hypothetical protein
MQKHAQLMGLEAMTGRALRLQVQLVIFALVFRLAARTGDVLVEPLGAGLLQNRHDKAGVDALVGNLDLDHHPARARPRPGLVARRVEAGDLGPTARLGPLGLRDHLPSQRL